MTDSRILIKPETTYALEPGQIITMPMKVRRTFWEWLLRKPHRIENKKYKVTQLYINTKRVADANPTLDEVSEALRKIGKAHNNV